MQGKKVHLTGLLAFQFKAPMMGVRQVTSYTLTQIQIVKLRSQLMLQLKEQGSLVLRKLELKVIVGAEVNCMPLSKFKSIFSHVQVVNQGKVH